VLPVGQTPGVSPRGRDQVEVGQILVLLETGGLDRVGHPVPVRGEARVPDKSKFEEIVGRQGSSALRGHPILLEYGGKDRE
jgi:hypothetical protein